MFLVNSRISAPALKRIILSLPKQDQLAVALVRKDPKYIPEANYASAYKEYLKKKDKKSYKLTMSFGWRVFCGIMFATLGGIYWSLNRSRQRAKNPQPNILKQDDSDLSYLQKKSKAKLIKQYEDFGMLIDAAQNHLNEEYRQQINDLQDFVEKKPTK